MTDRDKQIIYLKIDMNKKKIMELKNVQGYNNNEVINKYEDNIKHYEDLLLNDK